VATVRRIEGVLLHPVADAGGVHRFQSDEVDALLEDVVNGRVSLLAAMQRDDEVDDHVEHRNTLLARRWRAAEARAARLQRENASLTKIAVQLCSSGELRERVLAALAGAKKV
jgi:hypothetical protein